VLKIVASVTADTLAVYDCGFEEPNVVMPTGESYVVDVQDVLRFHYGVDDYRAPVNVGDIVVVRHELFAGCFVFVPAGVIKNLDRTIGQMQVLLLAPMLSLSFVIWAGNMSGLIVY
jgi:hypothetical protein